MATSRSFLSSSVVVVGLLASAGRAEAQGATPQPAAPPRETVSEVPGLTPASTTPMAVPEELLKTSPGGLTADQVGQRAMDTSFAAKQSLETMHAAQARMNAAWAGFLPRLSGTARYTRLSPLSFPSLGNLVATDAPAGPINPADLVRNGPNGTPKYRIIGAPLAFSVPFNNTLLQATLTIPLSDYLLRIDQTYTAATRSAEAARFDLGAARATALTNGKVAYYSWLQARAQVIVAVQALNDQRIHLNDSRNQFTVGNASKADVLRAETAEASAELVLVEAQNAADLAEAQMRIAAHVPATQRLVPGEGLDSEPPPFQGTLTALLDEGLASRYEVKSIKANAESARKTAEVNKAGRYPVVSAFGDAIYANPNPRIFPQSDAWTATWDVGVQATWVPNDILTANGTAADSEARANALEAQAQVTREQINIEITQDFQALKQAEFALGSTRRELASATEAYRVARELFNNGRGTFTTLTDSEGELTRARIDAINAAVNIRLAHVRLEHGVGRDLTRVAASR